MGTDGQDVRMGGRAARAAGQQGGGERSQGTDEKDLEGGFQSFFLVSIGKKIPRVLFSLIALSVTLIRNGHPQRLHTTATDYIDPVLLTTWYWISH